MKTRTKEECLKECETNKWAYLHINCSNMVETFGDMGGERYNCEICGKNYWLDYDEMR